MGSGLNSFPGVSLWTGSGSENYDEKQISAQGLGPYTPPASISASATAASARVSYDIETKVLNGSSTAPTDSQFQNDLAVQGVRILMSQSTTKSDESRDEFVRLLTGEQTSLFAYIATLLGDVNDASNVLQQTNMVLWKKADEFAPGTSFHAWARKVAYFQTLAYIRDKKRDKLVFDEELVLQLAAGHPSKTRTSDVSPYDTALARYPKTRWSCCSNAIRRASRFATLPCCETKKWVP